jgi:uncharacterized protein (DUF1697 family)
MPRYAAFLRGINVGGHRVKREDLRAAFQALGFAEVDTFRASGNVILTAGSESAAQLTARIQEGLAAALGYEVRTFLRAAREVRAMAAHEPFAPARGQASAGKLQVAMLSARPATGACEEALALSSDADRLAMGERELYWLPRGGTMESALDLKALGALLGPMTIRTKGTVEQLAGKHFSD